MSIWGVDTDLSPDADLSLSYILNNKSYITIFILFYFIIHLYIFFTHFLYSSDITQLYIFFYTFPILFRHHTAVYFFYTFPILFRHHTAVWTETDEIVYDLSLKRHLIFYSGLMVIISSNQKTVFAGYKHSDWSFFVTSMELILIL
jgi:hypothetical protein